MSVPEFTTEAALKLHYMQVRARLNPPAQRNIRPPKVVAPPPIEPLVEPAPECVSHVQAWGQRQTTILLHILKRQPTMFPEPFRKTIPRVRREVSLRYGITEAELCGEQRNANIVLARHIAIYVAKKLTGKSLGEIGRQFGGKDHTTVLSAVRRIDKLVSTDPDFAAEIKAVQELLAA